jgi:hypothetical protein
MTVGMAGASQLGDSHHHADLALPNPVQSVGAKTDQGLNCRPLVEQLVSNAGGRRQGDSVVDSVGLVTAS